MLGSCVTSYTSQGTSSFLLQGVSMDNPFIASSYRQMSFSDHKCAPDHGETSEPNSLKQVRD